MMDTYTICSEDLKVQFILPRDQRVSTRFDACGFVGEVILHDKHTFCVPEQRIPGRMTTWGVGLCGEFVTPGLAEQAMQGEKFPKFGVGLLTQKKDGSEYSFGAPYEYEPFAWSVEKKEQEITFFEDARNCMGYAAKIKKHYRVEKNALIMTAEFENVGEKTIPLQEYQHNFVAVDALPIGKGYKLELPYVKDDSLFADCCTMGGKHCDPVLTMKNGCIVWQDSMENKGWYRILESQDIAPCDGYYWKLTNLHNQVSIRESVSFVPEKVIHWGIEHCASVELYFAQELAPGESVSWQRTWTFED